MNRIYLKLNTQKGQRDTSKNPFKIKKMFYSKLTQNSPHLTSLNDKTRPSTQAIDEVIYSIKESNSG